ncbi:MAG: hypothetical protein JWP27_1571 [Flaviaesturariibacter sp.]|nr:hypothetical protein [Flaviaesturariibacter sp.]
MKLGDVLLKQLNKVFTPSTTVTLKVKGYDIVAKTDDEGRAIQAFVGTAREDGTIKGDRYARTLKHDRDGKLIKDHWERKGYAT